MHTRLTPKRPHFTPNYANLTQADREQLKKLKASPGLFANMLAEQIENGYDEFGRTAPESREMPFDYWMDLFPAEFKQ